MSDFYQTHRKTISESKAPYATSERMQFQKCDTSEEGQVSSVGGPLDEIGVQTLC